MFVFIKLVYSKQKYEKEKKTLIYILKFFLFQLTEVIGDKREREGTDDADVWQNMETVKDGNKNDKPKKKKKK